MQRAGICGDTVREVRRGTERNYRTGTYDSSTMCCISKSIELTVNSKEWLTDIQTSSFQYRNVDDSNRLFKILMWDKKASLMDRVPSNNTP